ncbi:alpha-protein kinase 3 [Salminus brasiliensis]|uniref:alpha-protein kinase 3 n=1 Tax=Salminus brasiliensis TaxID=930266 RepID=UPI003B833E93
MTSRRPMTRSYSSNGRSGSQNGEDVPSPRLDSRNYLSNVRPENSNSTYRYSNYKPLRSTFCTVMAHLTEETQPCFETTIKSKAVSEACNVKFTCVVTGYPVPELTWYKDDMELDRYCGLPKYEIFRNGKTHTLHIYNCTVEDAAIYQASARNSKGIVSCSGVLEVGAMSEYKIHQRFFAKLKQKAELKRRDIEESRRRGKENIQHELLGNSQDRVFRKRRLPEGQELGSLSAVQDRLNVDHKYEAIDEKQPAVVDEEVNGFSVETHEPSTNGSQENDTQQLDHVHEKEEIISTKQATKEKSRKKIRISNGFDEAVTNQPNQDSGGGVESEEMSLAKYLAASLQSQAAEEQQRIQAPDITITNTGTIQEKERESEKETEGEWMKTEDLERAQERSRERKGQEKSRKEREKEQFVLEHRVVTVSKDQAPAHKEPEHLHKSALSTVFHSLKDIFFGKGKKLTDTADDVKNASVITAEKEIGPEAHCYPQQGQDSTLEVCGMASSQLVQIEVDQPYQTGDLHVHMEPPLQLPPSLQLKIVSLDLDEQTSGFITDNTQMLPTHETNYNASESSFKEQKRAQEKKGQDARSKTLSLPLIEATDDHTEGNTNENMVEMSCETTGQDCSSPIDQVTQTDGEMHTAAKQDYTADFTQMPEVSLTGSNITDHESIESCPEVHLSQPVSHTSLLVETAPSVLKMQEGYSLIKESVGKDKNTETVEMTDWPTLHETRKECITNVLDELTLEPSMNEWVSPLQESIQENRTSIPTVMTGIVENEQQDVEAFVKVKDIIDGNSCSAKYDARKVDSTKERRKSSVEEEWDMSIIEKKADVIEKKGGNWTGENKNVSSDQASLCTVVQPDISKYTRHSEVEVLEAYLSPSVIDKSKTHTNVQTERYIAESKDPSVTPPIIILPDTRETVIKNVAKMRAVPMIPEIKVTVSEKIKCEEPVSVPRIEALVSEPERVMQPLAQVAHIFRDNEAKIQEPTDDAKREARDDKVVTYAQPVGVTPTQQERNVDWALPDQRTQELQNQEAILRHREDQDQITSGRNRANDITSIPIISIACADDVTPSQGQVQGKPTLNDTVLPDTIGPKMQVYMLPSVSTAHKENTPVNSITNEISQNSLAAILRKVEGDLNHIGSPSRSPETEKSALLNEQNMSDKINLEIQMSSNVHSPLTAKTPDVESDADRVQRDKPAMEKLGLTTPVGPTLPPLSPASLRRLMAKYNPNLESQGPISAISADGNEKKGEESGGSTPTSTLSCESSPKMKRRDSLTLIPSATPEELASGARRKIYLAKTKSEDEGLDTQNKRDSPKMSPSQARRAAFLQLQSGQQTPPMERRSPLFGRRKATSEVSKPKEETSEETSNSNTESKTAEKEKLDPFKAPQVIRKIRGEPFSDASGHLKLWCQFFNVLSDSTITWFKDEEEILKMSRSAGDESQVALAIVQASSKDCGVYGCTIKNEYGTDTTDYLLSEDILAEFFLRDDLEVGEEIEMTPLLFTKGLADPGYWGEKFFGRIMTEEVQIGEGYTHKTSRAKVIYGLEPIFESGSTCIAKVRNPIAYGTKEESNLSERNLEVTKQECKIQNTVREYCKIFAAEARVIDNFGLSLEVIPLYLMYRPANTIPYATVEAALNGVYLKYCLMDNTSRMTTKTSSEVEQKCCTFQHWIHQWTNGNLLVTQLEGVDTKITNIRIATKSKGYQSLTDEGSPKILEQFVAQHQCNYYCGLLGLRPLKLMDSLQQPKVKTSRSPLLARRVGTGSSSPQSQKKGLSSPQTAHKGNSSPKVAKKPAEDGEKHKPVDVSKAVRMQ